MRINVLGPLRVEVGARVLGPRDFGGAKPKQLLEALVAERGAPVPKERLAELLWGERLPRNVIATLETYVSVLRNRLEPGGSRGASVVVTEPGAYRLDTSRVEVDLDRFEALADAGAHDEALALVRGELLADEPYADWAVPLRDRYRRRLVHTLLASGEQALARGEFMLALARSDAAVAADALSERAYRLAMVAAYALGRQEDALRAFDRCAKALIDELGVGPMAETEALAAAINRHEDVAALLPVEAADADAAPARPAMIGRAAELAAVLHAAESRRLVLVEGESGVGKTRLLDEAADRLAARGVKVLRTACFELERSLPMVPLLALAGDGPGADDPLAVMDRLVAASKGAVVIVDDLQWADRETVAALGYAARRGVGVIGAHAHADVGLDHPLRTLDAERVALEALSREELDAVGLGHVYDETGGLPLFVSRAGEGLPASLRAAVLGRCHRAGPLGFQVLLSASAFEDGFAVEALAAAMGEDEARVAAAVEELVRLRQVEADPGGDYRLRYGIVRQVLQDSLTPGRRRILARRAVVTTR